MGFAVTVALRFLREGRFQSLLILVGVAAGVAVVTYISALIEGLQGNTIRRTLGTQAHLTVKAPDEASRPSLDAAGAVVLRERQPRAQRPRAVDQWQAVERELARTPGVTAVTAIVTGSALAVRGEAARSIALFGIELEGFDRIVSLRERMVAGQARVDPGEVLIGTQLAADLGVGVGERIVLRIGPAASDTVKVSGLFDLGVRDLNRRTVYASRTAAQNLFGLPGGATHVYATVDDLFAAERIAAAVRQRSGLELESWMESNAQLLSALNAQSISTGLIRGFTAAVVMLGIASVLVVSVVQKRKEIGILRAMGATRSQMTQVFLVQGAVVGLAGSMVGVALARLLLWGFSNFVRGSDGQPLFVVGMTLELALTVPLAATLAGVLAAVAPARRAASLDPAQAIRT
jgi:lipoprotein-releasing system permease protein